MTKDEYFKAGMRRLAGAVTIISAAGEDGPRGGHGAPMLNGALVNFECSLLSFVAAGTHQIFIGEVMAVHLGKRGRPLLYCDGSFSTSAA